MILIFETIVLGLIQGLTEWLPVSSSGHLVVATQFISWQPPILFFVLLHVGTLFNILFFFRRNIVKILKALALRDVKSEDGKLGVLVVFGSVPTAVIGLVFRGVFRSFFENILVVGTALIATGFLLFVSERREGVGALSILDSFLMGIVQGFAIIPGVSRSGATISIGLLRRVEKETVFRFSFLLSIPPIVGATAVEFKDLDLLVSSGDLVAVVAGVAVSIVVGYLSLKGLLRIVMKQKFHWFAYYCWIAGVLVIISQFF